ncbi:putative membrane protein [Bradyrhizobium sp. USDA 4454]
MSSTIPDRLSRKAPSLEPFGMLLLFAALTALPIVLTVHLVEFALVLPALSLLLFAEAAIAALAARVIHVRSSVANLTLWDFAGAFTFMGCAAAILGEPDQAALFFEEEAAMRPVTRP